MKVAITVDERKKFHIMVARLLYLAKEAWPDIFMITSYLCTQIPKATIEDARNFSQVLGYLQNIIYNNNCN